MQRKKPVGAAWASFKADWAHADKKGKISLAKNYGATYDTAKHWIVEGDTTPEAPSPKPLEISTGTEADLVKELMAIQPKVQLKFVTFDIETSNLKADFSIVLSAVIKPFGEEPIVFRGDDYPSWANNRADDCAIVFDITQELSKYAIVITHYGSKFDLPYLRAKMVNLQLPMLPPMFGIDTWRIAKFNFAVSSRRLAALGAYFGIGDKSAVDGTLWNQAAYSGSKEALDEIVAHNIQDCVLLEKLAAMSFGYLKSIPKA